MRRTLGALLCAFLLVACSGGGGGEAPATAAVDRDTLTRQQKDSIIANMPLPGAGAVGRALGAADAASARAAEHDAIP